MTKIVVMKILKKLLGRVLDTLSAPETKKEDKGR